MKNNNSSQYDIIDYSTKVQTSNFNVEMEKFFLDTFYVPENMEPLPREIFSIPYYQKYFKDICSREGDYCFIAQDILSKEVIGAAWTRIIDDIEVNCDAPFLLISVSAMYRGRGIGSLLLLHILNSLRNDGYTKVYLSVNRQNKAIKLYRRFGFLICNSDTENYTMVKELILE